MADLEYFFGIILSVHPDCFPHQPGRVPNRYRSGVNPGEELLSRLLNFFVRWLFHGQISFKLRTSSAIRFDIRSIITWLTPRFSMISGSLLTLTISALNNSRMSSASSPGQQILSATLPSQASPLVFPLPNVQPWEYLQDRETWAQSHKEVKSMWYAGS